ncbi:unnamed protein product [Brassica rapa subsp. trilocularis]
MYQTSYYRSPFGDTTFTKVFVGGLAWETPAAEMRRYFDQFGEILEAVIITDKNTGKSKGYGFVTFQEADSATRAVADPNPVIDGRKANCNIASFGRPRPSPPRGRGQTGSPSPYQSGGPSAYTGMAAPLPPASAAHQLMYPSYGYTYNPDQFRYHQAMYNTQLQQAQYYQQQQQLYGGGATSPSAATIMPSPYYYGYSLQASRVPYQHHLPQPYNPQQQQQHQRFTSPPLLVYPSSSPFSSPLQGLLSSSEESEAPQQVSAKVEATTAPESTSSNNKEPTSS